MEGLITAWGRILRGYRPNLSIEITRECPLRCPGCYAYGDEHLGGGQTLRDARRPQGPGADRRHARGRRSPQAPPRVAGRRRAAGPLSASWTCCCRGWPSAGSTCRSSPARCGRFPTEWASIKHLQICVSIDGLQPEHDVRRTPATYDRILKHIQGHQVTVHCTVTRQQVQRDGYIETFIRQWSDNPNVRTIWMSLYTPQVGEVSGRAAHARRSRPGGERADGAARALPEDSDAEGPAERLPEAARVAGRLRLRADDRVRLRRPHTRRSRRASSAAIPTAPTAAAWRRPA